MSLYVIGPGSKTANRRPDILWKYDGQQQGYAVGIISPQTNSNYWRIVTTGPQRFQQKHVFEDTQPLSAALYNDFIFAVCVKKPDNTWYTGNLEISSIARQTPYTNAPVRVTLSTPHGLATGSCVFIYGAADHLDGVFRVAAVVNSSSFVYVYSYGPFPTGPTTSYATGMCYIPATTPVSIFETNEQFIDFSSYKSTFYEDGDGVVAPGIMQQGVQHTVMAQKPHKLKKGDVIQIYQGTSSSGIKGVYKVQHVVGPTAFRVFSNIYYQGTVTGGYFIDFGFEDFFAKTKVEDMSGNSIKIESIGSFYPPKGTLILRRDSLSNDTYWGFISFDAYLPMGTSIKVRARSSNDIESLNSQGLDSGWSEPLISGDYIELMGRYLELEISLLSSDAAKTPILKSLHVAYQLRGEQEDLEREVQWNDFSELPNNSTVEYVDKTGPILYEGKRAVGLAVQNTVVQYADQGEFIIIHDANGLNNWTSFVLNGILPSSTLGTPCKVEVSHRFYNKMSQRNQTSWSNPVSFTNQSGDINVPLNVNGYRYGEFKVTLYPSSTKTVTPVIRSAKINWSKVVEGKEVYLYTTAIYLPSQLSSIIFAGRGENIPGTEISYGVSYSPTVGSFQRDYYEVSERELGRIPFDDENSDALVRIAVKLYSASTTGVPELKGFGFQMNLVGKEKFLPNVEEV